MDCFKKIVNKDGPMALYKGSPMFLVNYVGSFNIQIVIYETYMDLKKKAVGEQYWPIYFKQIKNLLKPEGTAAIQVITIDDKFFDNYRKFPDFIQKYIFPGGFLPSLDYIKKLADKNQLGLEQINSYSDDYAKTLLTWKNNFFKAWDNISPLGFDDYFKRMWEFYLCYCEAGFKAKNIDLIQFSMSNRQST